MSIQKGKQVTCNNSLHTQNHWCYATISDTM